MAKRLYAQYDRGAGDLDIKRPDPCGIDEGAIMSRAINLSMPEAGVVASCTKAGVSISAIEALPSGGTHLVCTTGEGAEEMRVRLKAHVIPGRVKRYAFASVRFTA